MIPATVLSRGFERGSCKTNIHSFRYFVFGKWKRLFFRVGGVPCLDFGSIKGFLSFSDLIGLAWSWQRRIGTFWNG